MTAMQVLGVATHADTTSQPLASQGRPRDVPNQGERRWSIAARMRGLKWTR
jgi:hypothetical protein